jgi:hypothetical protein
MMTPSGAVDKAYLLPAMIEKGNSGRDIAITVFTFMPPYPTFLRTVDPFWPATVIRVRL